MVRERCQGGSSDTRCHDPQTGRYTEVLPAECTAVRTVAPPREEAVAAAKEEDRFSLGFSLVASFRQQRNLT
jgi:hypothetical protein